MSGGHLNGKRKEDIRCRGMYTGEERRERNTSRAIIKRQGRDFSQATFIGKQKKNITERNP